MTNTQETYPNLNAEQLARADALGVARSIVAEQRGLFGGAVADRREGELIELADYILNGATTFKTVMPDDVAPAPTTTTTAVVTGSLGIAPLLGSVTPQVDAAIRERVEFAGGSSGGGI